MLLMQYGSFNISFTTLQFHKGRGNAFLFLLCLYLKDVSSNWVLQKYV